MHAQVEESGWYGNQLGACYMVPLKQCKILEIDVFLTEDRENVVGMRLKWESGTQQKIGIIENYPSKLERPNKKLIGIGGRCRYSIYSLRFYFVADMKQHNLGENSPNQNTFMFSTPLDLIMAQHDEKNLQLEFKFGQNTTGCLGKLDKIVEKIQECYIARPIYGIAVHKRFGTNCISGLTVQFDSKINQLGLSSSSPQVFTSKVGFHIYEVQTFMQTKKLLVFSLALSLISKNFQYDCKLDLVLFELIDSYSVDVHLFLNHVKTQWKKLSKLFYIQKGFRLKPILCFYSLLLFSTLLNEPEKLYNITYYKKCIQYVQLQRKYTNLEI